MTWPYMKLDFHDPEIMIYPVPHGEYVEKRMNYYSESVLKNGEFDRCRAGGWPYSRIYNNRKVGVEP